MQTTSSGPDIAQASEKGAERIERMAETAQDAVGRATGAAAAAIRRHGEDGERLGREWMETQEAWTESARECVRHHPITSVAVGVVIGMVLSRILAH